MPTLSKLLSPCQLAVSMARSRTQNVMSKRFSGHRTFWVRPSRWHYETLKDHWQFYMALGAIPCLLTIFLFDILIGPCELTDIPEGYEPHYWEYERDPLTQVLARYVFGSPQQNYEKYLHVVQTFQEGRDLRRLEQRARYLMAQRQDYRSWYYVPQTARWAEYEHWASKRFFSGTGASSMQYEYHRPPF